MAKKTAVPAGRISVGRGVTTRAGNRAKGTLGYVKGKAGAPIRGAAET